MQDMPRPRPPRLQRETTRHGKTVWYVRVDRGGRIRIRAEFGTPEFDEEYQAALSGFSRRRETSAVAGTLSWLVERYRETVDWTNLSLATRRQRENILRHVLELAGDKPAHKITERAITEGRDRRAVKTPAQARHFIDTMRGLFRWAAKAKHVKSDPTVGIDYPTNPNKNRGGFPAWTEEHVAEYYARWPIGTRQRVWLDVLLFTGLRRGDAVRLGRQHIRNIDGQTVFTMKTEKTGAVVTVEILPEFDATLRAGPCGDLAFIAGANGRPMTKESFGNEFREACRAAGVPGSAHGVRKLASTRVAEAGATDAEMDAIFGSTGGRMSSLYTRGANRVRLARGGMSKLRKVNEERTSIPASKGKVRERMRKDK
jgi:integrase